LRLVKIKIFEAFNRMQFINKAYLLIGGNVGDRFLQLQQAVKLIGEHCGKVAATSSIYVTAAWGNTNQPAFLNQAIELHTDHEAKDLMPQLLHIEELMGRKRTLKYGPRIIDIDILLFNNEVHQAPDLIIPHPELQNRLFALVPLAEIAASAVHPTLGKSISELVTLCPDKLEVSLARHKVRGTRNK